MLNLHITRITRQRRHRRQHQGLTAPRLLRWSLASAAGVVTFTLLTVVFALGAFALIYNHYARELPPAEDITAAQQDAFLTTVLYDRTGQTVIYEVIDPNGGDRRWLSVDNIPQYFLDATVAIEDASFYEKSWL